ncbi:ABC transporter substrate-binding protein [Oricola cellulosilytica]|uniref:ABC transporter substrate-binding protein n=1 Tax=Oricola cellulosilytica TaxID=1429082 RepID=A0A4R0PIN5_9HYPH|nr:ABC transporter substrate-binding protein [Oricola cellulosilytica]TCD16350.1 ABC transporter substrate-binding protein [Oricola cellulosilytica]
MTEPAIRLSRRAFHALVIGATVSLTAIAVPASAAEAVKIGVLSLTSHSAAFIAKEKGYFEEQDLDAELVTFQAAGPMAVAIASGDIDFGVTAISGALINLAEKGAVKVIGGALTEEKGVDGQKILVSNAAYEDGVTTPADLKGRSFGITGTGSSFHYMISQIAEKEGYSVADVDLKALQKVPAIIGALKSGQIDAWSIVPHIAKGLDGSGGAKIIGDVADYIDGYQVTTIFTSTRNVEENRELVERFLAAYSKGIAEFNATMVDKTEGEEAQEATTQLIHKYVYTDRPYEKAAGPIKAGAMRLQPNGRLNIASVEHQLNWFKSEGLVDEAIELDTLVDTSFVETQ